jgi:hypothetical protein
LTQKCKGDGVDALKILKALNAFLRTTDFPETDMRNAVAADRVTRGDPDRNLLYSKLVFVCALLEPEVDIFNVHVASMYLDNLEGIPMETLGKAFDHIVKTMPSFPKICHIIRVCDEISKREKIE